MESLSPELTQFRLGTEFRDDYAVHWTGQPRKSFTWRNDKKIGSGGFGSVCLQKGDEGQLRAVKSVMKDLLPAKALSRELLALVRMSGVRILGISPGLN